jgi:hypothetical protein
MHSVHSVDSLYKIHHSVRSKSGTHSVRQSASTRNRCSRTTEREQRSRMHSVQPVDLHQSLHSVGSKSRHTLRETKWKLKRQIQSTNRKRAEKPNVSSDRYNSKALGLLVSTKFIPVNQNLNYMKCLPLSPPNLMTIPDPSEWQCPCVSSTENESSHSASMAELSLDC